MTVFHAWEDGGEKWRIVVDDPSGPEVERWDHILLGEHAWQVIGRDLATDGVQSLVREIVRLLPVLTAEERVTVECAKGSGQLGRLGIGKLLAIIDRLTEGTSDDRR